jgi:hypothetical protein
MRIASLLIASLFALPLALTACGDDGKDNDAEPFATLQDCYDDHHVEENLPAAQAIVVCCIDHPIAGVHPSCGDTEAACVTHLDAELDDSVTSDEITAACADYIDQK